MGTMEEYREREMARRKRSRGAHPPVQSRRSEGQRPSMPRQTSNSSDFENDHKEFTPPEGASRKLSRKKYWEPQAIGGRRAPKDSRELRQRRADYFSKMFG